MLKCHGIAGMLFGVTLAGAACGQDYPHKPIRIVTSDVGGGNDFVLRLLAPGLADRLGQQVIVDNRGLVRSGEIGLSAPPDGYTLMSNGGALWFRSLLQKTPYDPVTDVAPIAVIALAPNILVVHPSVAANSLKELIALAKAKPGILNYSAGLAGTTQHLAAELFKSMAGINLVFVPYKGTGQALVAVTANEVQMMVSSPGSAMPYIKAGRLRMLAVTSAEPSVLLPGLPTVAATLPGYEAVSVYTLLAPAKTPAVIINRLNQETARVLKQPDIAERLLNSGVEPVGSSPQQLATRIKSEMAIFGKVIKDAGLRIE